MQTDTETARSLLNGIDDSGLSSSAYARAIRNAYYRGMNGVKFEDTPGYSDAGKRRDHAGERQEHPKPEQAAADRHGGGGKQGNQL